MFHLKHFGNILDGTADFPADTLPQSLCGNIGMQKHRTECIRTGRCYGAKIYKLLLHDSKVYIWNTFAVFLNMIFLKRGHYCRQDSVKKRVSRRFYTANC